MGIKKAWAQYHVVKNDITQPMCQGQNALLPLIRDKVNTLGIQCHIMKLNIKAVEALNPRQTPVDISDCPFFPQTNEAIYRFANQFFNYFAMFGGFHIEQFQQCLLIVHGQLIENSGLRKPDT